MLVITRASRTPSEECGIGSGPEVDPKRRWWRELRPEPLVTWVGEVPRHELAREYSRADVFCFPGVQEGFGIAFLEATGAGTPILATRAAAVPEVVRQVLPVEPDDNEALADGTWCLWQGPLLRSKIQQEQRKAADEYEMIRVSRRFMGEA